MGSLTPGTLVLIMRSLLTLVLAMAALTGPSERAAAQGAVKSVHNDWQVRCDTPPGAQGEQCAHRERTEQTAAHAMVVHAPGQVFGLGVTAPPNQCLGAVATGAVQPDAE